MKQFDPGLNWYKGNLHTHTTLSDGAHTPDEVIEIYRAKGYDFLALTDHRQLSMPETVRGMLLTGGVEFDYMLDDECIHIVGIGLRSAPELTPPMRGECAQQAIDEINARGQPGRLHADDRSRGAQHDTDRQSTRRAGAADGLAHTRAVGRPGRPRRDTERQASRPGAARFRLERGAHAGGRQDDICKIEHCNVSRETRRGERASQTETVRTDWRAALGGGLGG